MSTLALSARLPRLGLTSAFGDLLEPWNDWFQDSFTAKTLTLPRVNITENNKSYDLSLVAPGLTKKDFKIDVDGNLLTISAQKEESKEEKEEKYTRQEYNYSSFSRTFTLPEEVQSDKIDATYDGGILKLVLPKNVKVAEKNHKAITIK